MRGWAPSWRRRSIRSRATATAARSAGEQLVLLPDEREHRAVVVGVGVDVEQARVGRERRRERLDRRAVAALREVRDRLERQPRARTLVARLARPRRCVGWWRWPPHRRVPRNSATFWRLLALPRALPGLARRLGRARVRLAGGLARVPVADRRRRLGDPARPARAAAAADRDRARGRRGQGARDRRPPPDLGQPGARGRARPAQRALREVRAALVRLLRPPPDRPADVAGDRRPAERPLLPRLRADLLLPARLHGRRASASCSSSSPGSSR